MNAFDHLFIVGAGFSSYAGLPLTSEFTESLLDVERFKLDGPNTQIVGFLQKFVESTFHGSTASSPDAWPALEDLFTCIDLSANTGHHLGPNYSPSDLRTVRRALIVRTIRMLRQFYNRGRDERSTKWGQLERFFSSLVAERCAFLSMNWDTVIEEGLQRTQKINSFEYGCDAKQCDFGDDIKLATGTTAKALLVLKPHGSANWMYCDSCRQVFWFSPAATQKIAAQLFRDRDWTVVQKFTKKRYSGQSPTRSCPLCKAAALGTRFATFSYRKALDFPMHEGTWRSAEFTLRSAKTWIFIGYSLPAADYEFKLLLKRVQLSRRMAPKIILMSGGSRAQKESTLSNYKKFFGSTISAVGDSYFENGLGLKFMNKLEAIGAAESSRISENR